MKIRHFALAAGLILAAVTGAQSAPRETWIGTWGFVPTPLPPGFTPPVPVTAPTAVPLSAGLPAQPAPPPRWVFPSSMSMPRVGPR